MPAVHPGCIAGSLWSVWGSSSALLCCLWSQQLPDLVLGVTSDWVRTTACFKVWTPNSVRIKHTVQSVGYQPTFFTTACGLRCG
mmetsp:Transcript_10008/g.25873  ORF Transcript_10008/g.25873 Transcript_10008/m.25873 type:complete len:84 (-) Transcript_10008:339-590(-)